MNQFDEGAMIVPLPELYDVFTVKSYPRAYFLEDPAMTGSLPAIVRQLEDVFKLSSSPSSKKGMAPHQILATVKFLGRAQEFEVIKVVSPKEGQG